MKPPPSPSTTIRLLIVDDHPAFRAGLVALLGDQPDLRVVAECGDGQAAIEAFAREKPDLVLMDLRLPGLGGVEAIIAIRKTHPGANVIVLTTYDRDEDIYRAIQAGAKSYLLKDATKAEILDAIRRVNAGKFELPPHVAERLAARRRRQDLTPREIEILQLLVKGRSNKEIASALLIADDTVKSHLKALFVKLGVQDRTAAAISAVEHGIVYLG